MSDNGSRLVVVPSDPIADYERAGLSSFLTEYYNPQRMFQEVFAVSPLEQGVREAYGMTILGVKEWHATSLLMELQPRVVRGYGGYWSSDFVCRHRLPGVPVLVSVHDTNPYNLHRSVRSADLVICMSQIVAQLVIARGCESTRVRILPNRVNSTVFHPITPVQAPPQVPECFRTGRNIVHVGRKAEQKNLETLIRALVLLPAHYNGIFIGQGDAGGYQALAESLGLSERCLWIDSVPNIDLPVWFSWCDCMCTPSLWEGFGIVFIEAAACGCPIVTSDIAPMNEYLTHDASAFLVRDYQNPAAVAAAVLQVCEDPQYRQTLSEGALATAQPYEKSVVDAAEAAIYREAFSLDLARLSLRQRLGGWNVRKYLFGLLNR